MYCFAYKMSEIPKYVHHNPLKPKVISDGLFCLTSSVEIFTLPSTMKNKYSKLSQLRTMELECLAILLEKCQTFSFRCSPIVVDYFFVDRINRLTVSPLNVLLLKNFVILKGRNTHNWYRKCCHHSTTVK